MKIKGIKFAGFLLALCLAAWLLPVTAHAAGDGSFSYEGTGTAGLKSAVENELVTVYGQTPGSYDYMDITSLTLSGALHVDDYMFIKNSLNNVLALDLSGVTSAYPDQAFSGCTRITQVKLPAGKVLSNYMFQNCTSLTTLTTGSDLTANVIDLSGYTAAYYGTHAFQGCTGITQVKLPADRKFSFRMFAGCTSLTALGIGPGALTEDVIDLLGYTAASYDYSVFLGCTGITRVKLPAGKALYAYMFQDCTRLTTLTTGSDPFTENVIDLSGYTAGSYGEGVFKGCTGITRVKLPAGTALSLRMFEGCTSLNALGIGSGALTENVVDLSGYTAVSATAYEFKGCTGITQVKLPAGKVLSNYMFEGCTGLTTLTTGSDPFTEGVIDLSGYTPSSYGLNAFNGCTSITRVKLPADKPLSESMFLRCSGLVTLGIGTGALTENVIDLSGYTAASYGKIAFHSCTSITQVKLPAGKALSDYMFFNCSSLRSIVFEGDTAPDIANNTFRSTSNTTAYVPDSTSGGYELTAFTQHFTHVYSIQPPSFSTHPQSQAKPAGTSVTFSVVVSEGPTPTLQWQESTNGTDWSDLPGETTATLSFTTALSQNGYQYRCVAQNLFGSAISNPAALTILAAAPTPSASFSFDGENAGKLMGTTTQMKYSLDGGTIWTNCTADTIDLSGVIASITAENGIKVKDMGDNVTTAESAVQTIDITRAATPDVTPVQPSTIGGNGSIPMTAAHEYSADGGSTWTSAAGTTTLAPGAYLVRVKAAGTVLASDSQSITLTAYTVIAETTPSAVADYAAEMLTGLLANGSYAVNGADITADENGKLQIENTWFGTAISLVKKGEGINTNDSAAQSITLTARPSVPDCTVTQPSASSATGSISGVTADMEYSTNAGTSWTDGTGEDVEGLSPGVVLIRVKATSSAPAGLSQSITITAYVAPPPPSDSSTTPTPTYKADVNSGTDGSTTLPVTVDAGSGTAAVNTASGALSTEGTIVTMPSVSGVSAYTVGIPIPDLSTESRQGSLTVNTGTGSLTVPSNMLTGAESATGNKAQISIGVGDKDSLPVEVAEIIGDRPLISLTLSIDGRQTDWSNPDAPVTVSIPYTPTAAELANPEAIIVWYIDGSDNVVTIPNGRYDAATGTVTFSTTHFSDYAVAFNNVVFNDVADAAWYAKAVNFITARGITTGTGNGKYNPVAKLTRGEFIVLIMRAYGIAPDTDPVDNFSDAGDTYYTSYLAAAKRLGITAGVGNNMYAPGNQITRQEMFTLLYNALKVIRQLPEGQKSPEGDSGKTLSDFTDYGQIAPWASEAMTLLVKAGAVSGSGGTLNLVGTATRAEMAQMLYNLL